MGNRGTVHIKDTGVRLYTHWRASTLIADVAAGVARGESRWDDPPYLTRIVYDALVGPECGESTTGFGIDTHDEHGAVWVTLDCVNNEIQANGPYGVERYTFTEFVERYAPGDDDDDGGDDA